MPKVTVTFEGPTLEQAMLRAMAESQEYAKQILSHELQGEEVEAQMKAATGNGESKEDVIVADDGPQDNNAVLHCALDLLMTVYSSDDKAGAAVNSLLEKYSVDSLNDVEPERASELFADAEKLATDFGVSN